MRCTSILKSGLFVDYVHCSGFMRIQGAKNSHLLVILQQCHCKQACWAARCMKVWHICGQCIVIERDNDATSCGSVLGHFMLAAQWGSQLPLLFSECGSVLKSHLVTQTLAFELGSPKDYATWVFAGIPCCLILLSNSYCIFNDLVNLCKLIKMWQEHIEKPPGEDAKNYHIPSYANPNSG